MAYTTINKSTAHFNTKLYTGNGSTQSITGVGFQPDFTWIKQRLSAGYNHALFDAVRGATKVLQSNANVVERTLSDSLTAFGSDGFSLGADADGTYGNTVNQNTKSQVAWNWKANGQGSSNTDGSINTTYTSVNTTAGFSISSYTGSGSSGDTIGHGLGAVPKMIIIKRLTGARDWAVYHSSLGATKYLELNNTNAAATDTGYWNDTEPTSSLITFGNDGQTNGGSDPLIMYAFAEKTGYSKFGSYVGNGNADGTFVYTGFKPAFVMMKNTSNATSSDWLILDNKRDTYNVADSHLDANNSDAESSASWVNTDFLSNGFKLRTSDETINESTNTFIYMAFGQSIVGTNGVTAKAR